ncbi:metal-dependent hydrolase [Clostridium sp. YB-6]|uniref:Metal-dependent hydrolase n=2 Tax=Clostridium weizhouense TaxID=2859781 RepID=A0ABS7AT59_9CLOT|nr:metal-dependent hydrolase [Clostridium weizhouense]
MKRTHTAIGLATTIPLIAIEPISAIGILGSVVPDWDFYLGLKHRTITHSLLFLTISTAAISIFSIPVGLVWFINYALHLIADSFTRMGTPYLYPFYKRYFGLRKLKTRGAADYLIQLFAIFFICSVYLM